MRVTYRGIPQGSELGPILYIYIIYTFADDIALLYSNKDKNVAYNNIEDNLYLLTTWLNTNGDQCEESK